MRSQPENALSNTDITSAAIQSAYIEVINPNGIAPIILVCEHASNLMPEAFTYPLADNSLSCAHIAWDPGAKLLAEELSRKMDAPLVCSKVSRLIYDCNRPPSSGSAIPKKSELFEIPGNHKISEIERRLRIDTIYKPFHARISGIIDEKRALGKQPALVTIHSFTPSYFKQIRKTELGILHDSDSRLADHMLIVASNYCELLVERNKPYGPEDGVTHTLIKHGIAHALPNVMLEIKNDLLSTAVEIQAMADIVQKMLIDSITNKVIVA